MSEYVRLALLMLFKDALDRVSLLNGVDSEHQRSVYANAITELEALAPTPVSYSDERPIISMPERR